MWDVDQCVSAITDVDMPVLVCLRGSNMTDKGGPYEFETRAEGCPKNDRDFVDVILL